MNLVSFKGQRCHHIKGGFVFVLKFYFNGGKLAVTCQLQCQHYFQERCYGTGHSQPNFYKRISNIYIKKSKRKINYNDRRPNVSDKCGDIVFVI